jgi:hypothetical protein
MSLKNSVVIGYTGRRGAGKTLSMTNDAFQYYNAGYKIYTNMKSLSFAECIDEDQILELAKNDDFQDCALVLDEIQVLFDSRRSGRKQNINFLYFIQQIRKRNVHLLYTTQFSRRVDLGVREHTDIEARPKIIDKTARYGVKLCMVTYEDLTASYETMVPVLFRKVFIANEVYDFFDTNEKAVALEPIKTNVQKEKNKK